MQAILAPFTEEVTEVRPRRRYDLTPPEMNSLVRALLHEHPDPGNGRYAAYRIPDMCRYSNVARSVECTVFQQFFGDTPSAMHLSYGRYEAHSTFILVVDREQAQPAGVLRIIEHSECGLKTLNDIQQEPLAVPLHKVLEYHEIKSPKHCWDVGTVAVLKDYRGQGNEHFVGTMLYGLFHAAARRERIEHALAVLDGHAYRQLTEKLAVPFEPIAGTPPFTYFGVPGSRAVYLRIPKVVPNVERYMNELDAETRTTLRPFLARVIYAEGLPSLVDIR